MENHHYQPKHASSSGGDSPRKYRSRAAAPHTRRQAAPAEYDDRPARRAPRARTEDDYASERRPSRPRKRQKAGCGFAALYFIFIFGVSLCVALVAVFSANDVLALVKPDTEINVIINEDTTLSQISDQLDESGVVNYGRLFKLFYQLKGEDPIIGAGTYTLNPSMDYGQIVSAMTRTTSTTTVKVTIPEGYTLAQIRQTLIENKVTSEGLLDSALNDYPYKHTFLKDRQPPEAGWLEGYLFPDTYEFVQDSKKPTHEVINKMLLNFQNKYDEQIQEGATELGLSIHEVVTIASLVEREAKDEDEFPMIAGVILNRLHNSSEFPYLQIDAALQYAVGHNNKLTDADKALDSPYNLYKYQGLPPGPICNPGYNALYAATHPSEHDYYYYVAMPDGTHLFAETNDEHNRNRAKAERAFAAEAGE